MSKIKVVDMSHVATRFKDIVVTTEEYENYLNTRFDDEDECNNHLFSMCEAGFCFDSEIHELDENYE